MFFPRALIAALGSIASSSVFAQPASSTAFDSTATLSTLLNVLDNAINTWVANGVSIFTTAGSLIAGVLFCIVVIMGFLKSMLGGKSMPQFLGDLMMPAIVMGLVLLAITGGFATAVEQTLYNIAGAFQPSSSAANVTPSQAGIRIMSAFAEAAIRIVDEPIQPVDPSAEPNPDSVRAPSAFNWFTQPETALRNAMQYYLIVAISWLCRIVIGFVLLLCGALALAAIYLAKISLALGVALAPLMIPCILLQPLSFIFNGWFRFMITAGMQFVVVFAIGTLLAQVASSMTSLLAIQTSLSTAFVTGSGVFMVAIFAAYVMLKVPDLAAGLVQGDGTTSPHRITTAFTAAQAPLARNVNEMAGAMRSYFNGAMEESKKLSEAYNGKASGGGGDDGGGGGRASGGGRGGGGGGTGRSASPLATGQGSPSSADGVTGGPPAPKGEIPAVVRAENAAIARFEQETRDFQQMRRRAQAQGRFPRGPRR